MKVQLVQKRESINMYYGKVIGDVGDYARNIDGNGDNVIILVLVQLIRMMIWIMMILTSSRHIRNSSHCLLPAFGLAFLS